VRMRTKLVFCLSLGFLAFFCFGITDRGKQALMGEIPENASHMDVDDRYIGASVGPWVFGLVPSVFIGIWGLALLRADRREAAQRDAPNWN
jgi:hypothetical protein